MTKGKDGRKEALRALKRLAEGRPNDVVKLAYLSEEQMAEIDGLDLTALVEFKRHGNGAVELKLVDRAAELTRLQKELDNVNKQLASANAKLNNEKFTGKAPAAVVAGVRANAEKLAAQAKLIEESMAALR